jgi:hypothetical protein
MELMSEMAMKFFNFQTFWSERNQHGNKGGHDDQIMVSVWMRLCRYISLLLREQQ